MKKKPVNKDQGLKKHVSQMNELEVEFLKRQFRKVNPWDWTLSQHATERKTFWRITDEMFKTIFRPDAELIEFHRKSGSSRILIRSKLGKNGKHVCVVFTPEDKRIVTMWTNSTDYHHPNLILENYNPKLDVLTMYKKGRFE